LPSFRDFHVCFSEKGDQHYSPASGDATREWRPFPQASMMLVIRAGLRGVTGAIDPGPPLQGGPREEIYLFQIKYSVKNFS